MNTGQMLLVIGAMALLSTIALSVNRTLLENDGVALEAQSGAIATSLCQGKLSTLVTTGFDSLTIGVSTDTLHTPFAAFPCTSTVEYVQLAAPDNVVVGPSDLKRITVKVSSAYMSGGVTLRTLVGDF